ncbi:hypothetical protein ANCCAN_20037 [Ancylostoma caninum]|uniref:Glycine N-acyltransferase-like protein n=1 Tax=Ancylostoma caninum TaxID=29170 RepID=A0A368FPX9_ANCCA|nr:hypothetical protein ANCCAN_20037 [Ancylostoma caninum]
MLLTYHKDDDELRAIMCKYESDPIFYPIWHSIKFELEQAFPNTKLTLYSCQMGHSELFIAFKKNRITNDFFVLYCNGDLDAERFNEALSELSQLHPWEKSTMFMGEERITKAVKSIIDFLVPYPGVPLAEEGLVVVLASTYFTESNPSQATTPYPCKMYYMNREQMNSVLELKSPNLPPGYELGSADPVKDAEVITKTWRHAGQNEVEQTRAKLTHFPSSCVRYKDVPAGFEMIDPLGLLNHLFVLEQHRKKGLGNIIELDLAKKVIHRGFKVYKCVELFNTAVLAGSDRSPFWSTARNNDGSDAIYVFLAVVKE